MENLIKSIQQEFRAEAGPAVKPEMDNTNRNFKGQQKNETLLCFSRKHWIILIPHLIGFLIAVLALAALFIFISMRTAENIFSPLSSRITAVVLIMGITYGLHIFFLRFFNYYLQTFIITNFRVIDLNQTLYFKSSRDSIDIAEIQDLMCERNGIIKTVLNFGEIVITLSSAHASKTLRYIPNPEYYFKKINKTKPQYVPQPLQDKRQAGLEGLLSPPLTHIIR